MAPAAQRVLIVEDDVFYGHELREIVEDLGLTPLGPIPGIQPALSLISHLPIDAALLAVRVDEGLSFPVARALDCHQVPYAFVTTVPQMVREQSDLAGKPLVRKPFRRVSIAHALRKCGLRI